MSAAPEMTWAKCPTACAEGVERCTSAGRCLRDGQPYKPAGVSLILASAPITIDPVRDKLLRALTAMLEETEGTVTTENRGLGLARYQALEAVEAATGKPFMPSRRSA